MHSLRNHHAAAYIRLQAIGIRGSQPIHGWLAATGQWCLRACRWPAAAVPEGEMQSHRLRYRKHLQTQTRSLAYTCHLHSVCCVMPPLSVSRKVSSGVCQTLHQTPCSALHCAQHHVSNVHGVHLQAMHVPLRALPISLLQPAKLPETCNPHILWGVQADLHLVRP